MGSIIPKVNMDTQVPGAINPCKAVNCIYASHDTYLMTRRYLGSFFVNLFGEAVYYKSNITATVFTSSTEAEFVAGLSGAKYEKYI